MVTNLCIKYFLQLFQLYVSSLTVIWTKLLLCITSGSDKLNTIRMHNAALIGETQRLKNYSYSRLSNRIYLQVNEFTTPIVQ